VLATRKYVDDKAIEVKAYADDQLKKHVADANPHKQYLQINQNLKEIADAGSAAVANVLKNLGLGEAAKRGVGTGANQIPDMTFFESLKSDSGWQHLPGGLIIQWGYGSAGGEGNSSSGVRNSFNIVFPNAFLKMVVSHQGYGPSSAGIFSVLNMDRSGYSAFSSVAKISAPVSLNYIAIGY